MSPVEGGGGFREPILGSSSSKQVEDNRAVSVQRPGRRATALMISPVESSFCQAFGMTESCSSDVPNFAFRAHIEETVHLITLPLDVRSREFMCRRSMPRPARIHNVPRFSREHALAGTVASCHVGLCRRGGCLPVPRKVCICLGTHCMCLVI